MHIVRSILGVFVAAVVAIILIMIGHMVNTLINLPAGLNLMDQDAIMAHYKEHGPTTPMLIGVLVTYAVAAFVAGFLAALIAGWAPRGHALVVGVLLTCAGLANLLTVPFTHPVWFWTVNLVEFVLAAWLGSLLVRGQRRAAESRPPPAAAQGGRLFEEDTR